MQLIERIFDVMAIQPRLNEMAAEFTAQGYTVKRGAFGIVLLQLNDGVVAYLPSGKGIMQHIYTMAEARAKGYGTEVRG